MLGEASFHRLRHFDDTFQWCDHLVTNRRIMQLQDVIIAVELCIFLQLCHIAEDQHLTLFLLEDDTLKTDLHEDSFLWWFIGLRSLVFLAHIYIILRLD